MNRFEKRLLEHIRHEGYTPARLDTLIADLGIDDDGHEEFRTLVSDLNTRGMVVVSAAGLVQLPSIEHKLEKSPDATILAVFRKIMKGGGFAQPLEPVRERSIFIDESYAKDALSGDTVKIKVWRDRARERQMGGVSFTGEIVEVVKRKRTSFSGEILKKGGQWLVYPDGKEITQPIVVRDAEAKNVRDGLKVVVDVVVFPELGMLPEGVITKVLGEAGRPDVETQATIAAYNLPGEFPEECVEQARQVTQEYDHQIAEYSKRGAAALTTKWGPRADLTGDFIITIDPPDAKDYDDAISIRRSSSVPGGWELGVNIADVEIAHSSEGDRGVLILVGDVTRVEMFRTGLTARGYRPALRYLG